MARLTVGQKCIRVLNFLLGLRDSAVAAQLATYGFDQDALDEGWSLLRKVAGERLDATPPATALAEDITALDAWENRWFPIASAVLRRHAPDVHAEVFHNLVQTEGAEVIISVGALIERLEELAKDKTRGKTALAILARHGVTKEVLNEARTLLVAATRVSSDPGASNADEVAEHEQAMWSYYLQWSAIARSVISDRGQLRRLGFLKPRRGPVNGEQPADDVMDDDIVDDDVTGDDDMVDDGVTMAS